MKSTHTHLCYVLATLDHRTIRCKLQRVPIYSMHHQELFPDKARHQNTPCRRDCHFLEPFCVKHDAIYESHEVVMWLWLLKRQKWVLPVNRSVRPQNIIGLFGKPRVFSNYYMSPLLILISNHQSSQAWLFICGDIKKLDRVQALLRRKHWKCNNCAW